MAHPLKHAESSAEKFGGKSADYLAIHNWFDESKAFFADFRHRALRHHAEAFFWQKGSSASRSRTTTVSKCRSATLPSNT
jgi:hypothetical protein